MILRAVVHENKSYQQHIVLPSHVHVATTHSTMENNIPGQRTTLSINEAFCFLDSAEYKIHESTAPHEAPLLKRAVSESGIIAKNLANNKLRETLCVDRIEENGTRCNGHVKDGYSDVNSNIEMKIDSGINSMLASDVNEGVTDQLHSKKGSVDGTKTISSCEIVSNVETKDIKVHKKDIVEESGNKSENTNLKGDDQTLGCDNNFLVVPNIEDDGDSGCSDSERLSSDTHERSCAEVISLETVNDDIENNAGDKSVVRNGVLQLNLNDENNCNDDKTEKSDFKSTEEKVEYENQNDEVVKMRPKSITSPTRRQRTTEIVSDAFGFLKEIEAGEEIGRRSSGYKSSNFSDEVAILRNSAIEKLTNGEISSRPTKPSEPKKKQSLKRQKSHRDDDDEKSEDSSDEDTGIYNESFRNSCWICLDSHTPMINDSIDEGPEEELNGEDKTDDVFVETPSSKIMNGDMNSHVFNHKRSDSTATTASEREFKRSFQTRRKCFVQRNDSQQEYERMSCRVFDNEKVVTMQKKENETGFGLHILDTQPVIISGVDTNSPACRAGVKEGQILLMVNGVSVLDASHDRIISLVQQSSKTLQVEVANTDIHYIRDLQKPVMSGYLYKQKESTFIKSWKRRYCVLRQDNCLYYFKNEGDLDPLGAIPMLNYLVSRHQDNNKDNCFKAEKYGAKTYYFSVDNRDDMARWVGAMNEASMLSKKRKESWMDVTSHNVGLPALEVRKPECSGYLLKCARTTKAWQKRYCILKDACIYYYKNMYSPRAQGMAHLHGYMIQDASKKFSFTLKPPESQMRQFTFAADNETDKKRWVDAMTKSIQRWIKVD